MTCTSPMVAQASREESSSTNNNNHHSKLSVATAINTYQKSFPAAASSSKGEPPPAAAELPVPRRVMRAWEAAAIETPGLPDAPRLTMQSCRHRRGRHLARRRPPPRTSCCRNHHQQLLLLSLSRRLPKSNKRRWRLKNIST